MKTHRRLLSLLAPTLLVAGHFMAPVGLKAADSGEAAQITALLADAKAEAVELNRDADEMLFFSRSKLSWSTFASKAEMIKGHVNNTGKLLAKLQDAEATGSPWQRSAIKQIEPLLRELAANTETTITYLNENRAKIHFPEFQEYVKANSELAKDLEALISDFVNYGDAKQKFDRLGKKREIPD